MSTEQRKKQQNKQKNKHKKKQKEFDPVKAKETAERIAAIEKKRQSVIEIVRESLAKKLSEKLALQKDRADKEERAEKKIIRDADKTKSEKQMLQIRDHMGTIVEAGIKSVYTSAIVPKKIKYDGKSTLTIKEVKYKLRNNLHIVGWGREAITMSSAFERIVGKQLKKGWMVVPRKSLFMMWTFPEAFPKLDSRITYIEGGTDGKPDNKAVQANRKIIEYCKKLKKKDILIVMLSHDIDDLLCCPKETISLKDKLRLLNRLEQLNATPEEINIVRNKLSAIRGGDLARLTYPAKIIILITSDIVDEPMDFIGGGPCTYYHKGEEAFGILAKYNLINKISQSIRDLIQETVPWETVADSQLDDQQKYNFVQSYVIACNADAIEYMAIATYTYGLLPVKLNSGCSGTIEEFAREYVKMASLMILAVEGKITKFDMYEIMKDSTVCPLTDEKIVEIFPSKEEWALGLCLLLGGRPTIDLSSNNGKSGPNQELALYFARYWHLRTEQYPILRMYTVWFLGGSSYGRDGNMDAAGAFGYKNLYTDIYPEYKKIKDKYRDAHLKWFDLVERRATDEEILDARGKVNDLKKIKKMYASILPDTVLNEHNTNLLLQAVNDGDELFELKTGNYYTFTNVGDIYAIRIVRFQCNCDGLCHKDILCDDKECPVNLTSSNSEMKPFCGKIGEPKQLVS
ncbi:glycerate kinase-like [Vespula maculifrons]|uniref:Glycerate kinase-like n=1 Tax=Vespula maculifrons TaxID=7453 RepID=A0ABD2D2H1_VESMC